MNKLIYLLFAIALLMTSCNTTNDIKTITVASRNGDSIGVGSQNCLLVQVAGDSTWGFLYQGVNGFNYEPGYEYVLEVKGQIIKNTFADKSPIQYVLVKEVSKTQKESENMPEAPKLGLVW